MRIELDHLPGEWVDVKPLSVGVRLEVMIERDQLKARVPEASEETLNMAVILGVSQHCITAWSFDYPVTPESVGDQADLTLAAVWTALAGGNDPNSDSSSSPVKEKGSRRRNG